MNPFTYILGSIRDHFGEGPGNYPEELTPSPSGMLDLTSEGVTLLANIRKKTDERPECWVERLLKEVPLLSVEPSISDQEMREIERRSGIEFPSHLKEIWSIIPGAKIKGEVVFCSPGNILYHNEFAREILPEVMRENICIAGLNGDEFLINLIDWTDTSVRMWDHEVGWTDHVADTLYEYLSERIAWHVTYMVPLCYQYGYVSPWKYW